jgi:GNAT superfamily N-acetyltransferase
VEEVPFLEHPRALCADVARAVGGRAVEQAGVTGFLNSRHDRFLNQLFADATVAPDDAAAALDGRPGFVWLAAGAGTAAMAGMTAHLDAPPRGAAGVARVRSHADLDDWHHVYREVFGSDARGRDEWRAIQEALAGDPLVLLLARVGGEPAATAAVYFHGGWAGLYCFTTRERMRGRGLATALVHAAHVEARGRGVERALLHATASGRPVYARAGFVASDTEMELVW